MGNRSRFGTDQVIIGENCRIDESAQIKVEKLEIGHNTRINQDVSITASHLTIGVGCVVDQRVQIINADTIVLGDHTYVGPAVRIIGGTFSTGDYSKIHQQCYVYAKRYVELGHLAWVGQGTHLDGTGGIRAGHFLGIGINSALYSHIRHGDVWEGCTFDRDKELTIGDDVWFVGMCLVSPVNALSKSVALLGSVIVKDMGFNRVYGGNPGTDLTDKIGIPWRTVSTDEKASKLRGYIETYYREVDPSFERDRVVVVEKFPETLDDRTFYNVRTREYTKHNHPQEISFNKWLFGYRAKFIPRICGSSGMIGEDGPKT